MSEEFLIQQSQAQAAERRDEPTGIRSTSSTRKRSHFKLNSKGEVTKVTFEHSPKNPKRGRSPRKGSPRTPSGAATQPTSAVDYSRKLNELKSQNIYMQKSKLYNTF